jgi:N-acyl-D-amino-acid deacylase
VKPPDGSPGPGWATLVLRNGRVLTMDPARPQATAVAAHGARILAVGSDAEMDELVRPGVTQVHDVGGGTVAPGFIDIHAHLDGGGSTGPEVFVRQGVTTVVTGNCGVSVGDVGAYLAEIDAVGAQCNIASYVGPQALRREAGQADGYGPLSAVQLARLEALVETSLEAGAVGVSFGPMYSPGTTFEEQLTLARLAAARGAPVASHVRHAGARAPEAVREVVDVGRAAGCPVQVSHVASIAGVAIEETLAVVVQARDEGLDVTADCYPYDAWSTFLKSAVFDGDWRSRHEMGFADVEVISGPHLGERLTDELFRELRAAPEDTTVVGHGIPWRAVSTALRKPWCMVASDGMPEVGEDGVTRGHPRMAGTFPRVLGPFVRDERLFDLEEALFKMTALPAWRLRMAGKGVLAAGRDADLVVFDAGTIADTAGYEPERCADPPAGVHMVFVRGVLTVHNGVYLGALAGRAARPSPGAPTRDPEPDPPARWAAGRANGAGHET